MKRPFFIVIQKQHQFILLALTASRIQCELVAELTLQDSWEEQGAEREVYSWYGEPVLGDAQVGLVGAEGDQS